MAISQLRSRRTVTGARYVNARKKKKYELGGLPTLTKMGATIRKQSRVLGDHKKIKLLSEEHVNVSGKDNKCTIAKIITVSENHANRHYVRRNIITKGSIVTTDKGKVRITSRPGQNGALHGVLV